MEVFSMILKSDHSDKDVCFRNLEGSVDERDAILKPNSPFHWKFDTDGQSLLDVEDIILENAVTGVRVFSDDGKSEYVNVIIPGYGTCQVERKNLIFKKSSI
ncbi:hypothetical protein PHMEG_0003078 [Phytophthora megakarya]|uniref:Uncharacterized protein n=1 Tax=Phytophthora megakarya TaxID=4795 RepID=A0A225WYY3_9STRA|nr:hypothetical protein PHMEG_0003078 [Phytophthora megakarya]